MEFIEMLAYPLAILIVANFVIVCLELRKTVCCRNGKVKKIGKGTKEKKNDRREEKDSDTETTENNVEEDDTEEEQSKESDIVGKTAPYQIKKPEKKVAATKEKNEEDEKSKAPENNEKEVTKEEEDDNEMDVEYEAEYEDEDEIEREELSISNEPMPEVMDTSAIFEREIAGMQKGWRKKDGTEEDGEKMKEFVRKAMGSVLYEQYQENLKRHEKNSGALMKKIRVYEKAAQMEKEGGNNPKDGKDGNDRMADGTEKEKKPLSYFL